MAWTDWDLGGKGAATVGLWQRSYELSWLSSDRLLGL